jgi:hypothetical protein
VTPSTWSEFLQVVRLRYGFNLTRIGLQTALFGRGVVRVKVAEYHLELLRRSIFCIACPEEPRVWRRSPPALTEGQRFPMMPATWPFVTQAMQRYEDE